MTHRLIRITVAYLALEAACAVLVRTLHGVFPWLIGPRDVAPDIPTPLVERHVAKSFDPHLGWCRRPGERGTDDTALGTTHYLVDRQGRRHNPGFDGTAAPVACFGDSYVFCRLVDDDQTWPHHLSGMLGRNVANYGVGNYGLDQALLRLERELPTLDARVVIMGLVPETIARVHSYWKHFFEYGNVLAFKPRFTLGPDGLILHPSPIRTPEDYAGYRRRLGEIIELDPFYSAKFRRDLLRFPYVPRILRRARRHVPVLAKLVAGGGRQHAIRSAFDVVLRDNARWTARLYADPDAASLLAALIERFAHRCRRAGKEPVLLVVPQPADLRRADAGTAPERLLDELRCALPVVDMTTRFRADHDPAGLFTDGRLGPHCSPRGNRVIAAQLHPIVQYLLTRGHPFVPASRPIVSAPGHPGKDN